MKYECQIIEVLKVAGKDGLSLKKLVVHVHNRTHTLFDNQDIERVYSQVAQFVRRNASGKQSLFIRKGWGTYILNSRSPKVKQIIMADNLEKI